MAERTTESEIAFMHPFSLDALVAPQPAGTYRLVVDEELIEGLSFTAYKRVATHLEIPALSVTTGKRQFLQVTQTEIDAALELDSKT